MSTNYFFPRDKARSVKPVKIPNTPTTIRAAAIKVLPVGKTPYSPYKLNTLIPKPIPIRTITKPLSPKNSSGRCSDIITRTLVNRFASCFPLYTVERIKPVKILNIPTMINNTATNVLPTGRT